MTLTVKTSLSQGCDSATAAYPAQAHFPDRHYSGYDHRPHDFSGMPAETLGEAFNKTRFAQSLTNLNPRHYTPEEKALYYTLEFAEKALASGDISAPKDRAVFWSGGYVPGHPLGYGLGRIIAERWLVEKNAVIEAKGEAHFSRSDLYHTVAMTEAGLPVLNPMWDDMGISMETKHLITPVYIINFARTARGEVTLNVDDTDMDSFFRKNEIQVLMANPDITSVRVVRVDMETDRLVEKIYPDRASWYEDQKDQWVQSIITRFNLASKSASKDAAADTLLKRMSKALRDELADCETNIAGGNPLLRFKSPTDAAESAERERGRVGRLGGYLR